MNPATLARVLKVHGHGTSEVQPMTASPQAAASLTKAIGEGLTHFDYEADDAMGATDCPEGCVVEPDGHCPHGYMSAALTAGLI